MALTFIAANLFSFSRVKTIHDVKLKDCPGSLRFIPKGTLKGKYIVENVSAPTVCVDVYFDIMGGPKCVSYSYDNKKLDDKFLKLYRIWSKREVGYYAKAMSALYEIIAEIQCEQDSYLDEKQRGYMHISIYLIIIGWLSLTIRNYAIVQVLNMPILANCLRKHIVCHLLSLLQR